MFGQKIEEPIKSKNSISLEFGAGFINQDLDDLKNARDEALPSLPVNAQVTDDYPMNPVFKFSGFLGNNSFKYGLSLTHYSTGSRIHYADYSGSYTFDNILTYREYCVLFKLPVTNEEDMLDINFSGEIGFYEFTLKSNEIIKIGKQKEVSKDSFEESDLLFAIGFDANYIIHDFILGGSLKIIRYGEEKLTVGFQGIRGFINVGYRFSL